MRLSAANLAQAKAGVERPRYDRSAVGLLPIVFDHVHPIFVFLGFEGPGFLGSQKFFVFR